MATNMASSMPFNFHTADWAFEAEWLLSRGTNLMQISIFCVCVYGALGVAWAMYLKVPEEHPKKKTFELALNCVTFTCMSAGMHVLNKSLVSSLQAPSLVTSAQMVMAAGALCFTSFKQLMEADRKMLIVWMLIPGMFSAMLISSFYSYQFISLSLLTVVRNLAPLVSLTAESIFMPPEKRPVLDTISVISILVMLAGAIVYAGGLHNFSMVGVLFAVLNLCLAVVERNISRRLLLEECHGLPLQVCTMVNNAVGLIPTVALAFITSETASISRHAAAWTDPRVLFLMVLSGAIGIGIGYFGFAVAKMISATSFFVLQNVSKIAVVLMGIVFFADPIQSPFAMSGLLLSLGGSYLYGKSQMDLQAAAAEQKKLLEQSEKNTA